MNPKQRQLDEFKSYKLVFYRLVTHIFIQCFENKSFQLIQAVINPCSSHFLHERFFRLGNVITFD